MPARETLAGIGTKDGHSMKAPPFESCQHGNQAPRQMLNDLSDSQAGTGRHKCPICAYEAGVQEGLRRAAAALDRRPGGESSDAASWFAGAPEGRLKEGDRPFYKAVISFIREAREPYQFEILAGLIKRTEIPANHDEIIAVWNEALLKRDFAKDRGDYSVPAMVLAEKARFERMRRQRG